MALNPIPSNNAFAWRPFIRQWSSLLVPLFYLAIVFWLQPTERLGESEKAPWLGRWIYDDYDPAAYALRGLNAALGRKPGRQQDPATLSPEDFCEALDSGPQECDSTTPYFLEYPHAVLLLFRLGYIVGNDLKETTVPAAVCNARQHNLVAHFPRTEAERNLWRHLRRAMQLYAVVTTTCLVGLMLTLKWGYRCGTDSPASVGLLLLPAALYFTACRFDIVPALLSALSLASLGRRWLVASAVLLGAATMVKVYPLLFAPLVVRYLWAQRKDALIWGGAYTTTLAALLLPPLALYGWDATWTPYVFQLSRSRSEGWTLYGYVLPRFLGNDPILGGLFRMGTLFFTELAVLWSRPRDLSGLLRRAALI